MEPEPRRRTSAQLSQSSSTPPSVVSNPQNQAYYNGGTQSPQRQYFPTDSSLPNLGGTAGQAAAANPLDPSGEFKRTRACEACRALKVRCDPDPNRADGTCVRCAKAKRVCVTTTPPLKRHRRADNRVAELEKKVSALTASLAASRKEAIAAGTYGMGADPTLGTIWPDEEPKARGASGRNRSALPSLAGNKRQSTGDLKTGFRPSGIVPPLSSRPRSPPQGEPSAPSDAKILSGFDSGAVVPLPFASLDTLPKARYEYEYTDVIDRKLVPYDTAVKAFKHYVNDMAPHFPAIVFSPEMTASEMRKTKPLLFLTILAVSISPFDPDIPNRLMKEVHQIFADRVIIKGEKSLELVQAIMVSILWYYPPDHYEELKFYQYIHIAVAMAMDLGMNRRTKRRPGYVGVFRGILGRKAVTMDPNAPEVRRVWLGCYFMAVNACISLRRPVLTRWQPYTDECIEILEKSPDALPSDKALIQWVKMVHIGEEVVFQFSMDDPLTNVSISEPKTQYTLKGFERQLDEWHKELSSEPTDSSMRLYYHILDVYVHEIGMHTNHNIDDFTPPFSDLTTNSAAQLATPGHVDALTSCLTSVHKAFDTFVSISQTDLPNIPTIHFVRTMYAAVVLIKLHAASTSAGSPLSHVFKAEDLKLEHYIDNLIKHMRESGSRAGGRVCGKFAVILSMLAKWYFNHGGARQDEGRAGPSNSRAGPSRDVPSSESARRFAEGHGDNGPTATPFPHQGEAASAHAAAGIGTDQDQQYPNTRSKRRHSTLGPTDANTGSQPASTTTLPNVSDVSSTGDWPPYSSITAGLNMMPTTSQPFTDFQGQDQTQLFSMEGMEGMNMPPQPFIPADFWLEPEFQLGFEIGGFAAPGGNMWDESFNYNMDGSGGAQGGFGQGP